jgi:hypothetical protein
VSDGQQGVSTWFRHADPRFPFLWETPPQPAARWHATDDGPATYCCSTPDGAWAELLRHEEITEPDDLAGLARRMWAVEVPDTVTATAVHPGLSDELLLGGVATYPACQSEARRARDEGATALLSPSAALRPGAARGQRVEGGLREAADRDGDVLVLFGGQWPAVRGWVTVDAGAPDERVLGLVRHFGDRAATAYTTTLAR